MVISTTLAYPGGGQAYYTQSQQHVHRMPPPGAAGIQETGRKMRRSEAVALLLLAELALKRRLVSPAGRTVRRSRWFEHVQRQDRARKRCRGHGCEHVGSVSRGGLGRKSRYDDCWFVVFNLVLYRP